MIIKRKSITFWYIKNVLKSIETEAVFTKIEMNDEGNINFIQNSSSGLQYN